MAENFFKLKKQKKSSAKAPKTVEKALFEVLGLVMASHLEPRKDTVTAFAPVSLSCIARDEYDSDLYADVVITA
jgi:hypothetical protein